EHDVAAVVDVPPARAVRHRTPLDPYGRRLPVGPGAVEVDRIATARVGAAAGDQLLLLVDARVVDGDALVGPAQVVEADVGDVDARRVHEHHVPVPAQLVHLFVLGLQADVARQVADVGGQPFLRGGVVEAQGPDRHLDAAHAE